MNRRLLLVGGVVVALAIAIALVTPFALPDTTEVPITSKFSYASLNLTASVEVKVLRSGKLVGYYRKVGDPVTKQFYYMLIDNLFGWVRTSSPKYWYDIGGSTRTWIDTENDGQNPVVYIAIGQGQGTPSRNDYALFSEVMTVSYTHLTLPTN